MDLHSAGCHRHHRRRCGGGHTPLHRVKSRVAAFHSIIPSRDGEVLMATATGHHAHPLNLMACVRESSPQELHPETDTASRHETSKKRRFHPFRGLRRMFRRKVRQPGADEELAPVDQPGGDAPPQLDSHRSRSTSELLAGDDPPRRRSGNGLYPVHSGLSVSHDSVFTAEQRSPHSSSEDLDTAQSSSSLSIQQLVPGVRAELLDAVRRRRGRGDTSEDDEDLGLPRSPCNSPTTADVLLEKGLKENPTKSHSTCSDGSLLSMGSSEMDEDSLGQRSGSSSKLSLNDKKTYHDNDLELDLGVSATPLSHSAARHKMAVRPKRTHGAPRRRRMQQIAAGSSLPTTPEVNEELSGRSVSPEVRSRHELSTTDDVDTCVPAWPSVTDRTMASPVGLPRETRLKSASLPPGIALSSGDTPIKLTRSSSNAAYRQTAETSTITAQHYKQTVSAFELDSSVASALASETLAKSRDVFGTVGEEDEEDRGESSTDDKINPKEKEDKREESSFFGRLLSRRSGKKKKDKLEDVETTSSGSCSSKQSTTDMIPGIPKRMDEKGGYANESLMEYSSSVSSQSHSIRQYGAKVSGKSTAALRQRIEPINLPPSPEPTRKDSVPETTPILTVAPSIPNTVNRNVELENLTGSSSMNRMQISYSVSPPKPTWPEPRHYSTKMAEPSPAWQGSSDKKVSDFTSKLLEQEPNDTDYKSRLKIAGLSSYQQRITQIGNDLEFEEREFNSLITTTEETIIPKVSVKKSQSFKNDVDYFSISQDKSNIPLGVVGGGVLPKNFETQDIDNKELVKKSGEVVVSNVTKSVESTASIVEEQPSFTSSKMAPVISEGDEDELSLSKTPEKSTDVNGKHFTKNVYVTSRNVVRDNNIENKALDSPVFKLWHSRQAEPVLKKSSSLDSINSFGEVKKSPSPELVVSTKKSSSSDSINSLTQQVTMPVSSSGISITQTVRRQDETKLILSSKPTSDSVTVALPPTSADPLPSSASPDQTSLSPQETSKQPELARQPSSKTLQEKENPSVPTPTVPAPTVPTSTVPTPTVPTPTVPTPTVPTSTVPTPTVPTPTPRLQPMKREIRPLVTSQPHIPEFLRVQLNRVDSKPTINVVLSTSAVFDMDKNDTPRMISDKGSRLRNLEEKLVDKQDTEETNTNELTRKESVVSEQTSETATPTVALRIVRKQGKEDISTAAKDMSKTTDSIQKSKLSREETSVAVKDTSKTTENIQKSKSIREETSTVVKDISKTTESIQKSKPNREETSAAAKDVSKTTETIQKSKPSREETSAAAKDTSKTTENIQKSKPNREESTAAAKDTSKTTENIQKPVDILSTNKSGSQEVIQKISETNNNHQESEKTKVDNTTTPAPVVKTQRSISTGNAPSQTNRKFSIVSISPMAQTSPPPSVAPSPSTKPPLKKQSGSLDSAESRNAMLKKQKSFDFENITIVEKQAGEAVANIQETSYQEVSLRKKSLPWEIVLKKDDDNAILVERPASRSESVSSQDNTTLETFAHKKPKSREFGSKKEEDSSVPIASERLPSVVDTGSSQDTNGSDVVLRKKSLSREIGQRKEEEPELLKVFARRSLKLKDCDSEALGQQVAAKARESQSASEEQAAKSRDSDKENEGGDSPREERKTSKPNKEPLSECKLLKESGEPMIKASTVGITLNNPRNGVAGGNKYQRSFSSGSTVHVENSSQNNETILAVYQKDNTSSPEKRQRNKTVPESPRTDSNHVGGEKNSHRAWANMYKENTIDMNNSETNTKTIIERKNSQVDTQNQSSENEEISVPRFKRIQQRKEEWELRAQQASKKTLP